MIDINAKKHAENCVHRVNVIIKDNKSILWIKMHNVQIKMVVKNISNLTIKLIRGNYNTETPTSKLKEKRLIQKKLIDDSTGIYIREELVFMITIHSTVPKAVGFKTKLELNPYDPIMRKK